MSTQSNQVQQGPTDPKELETFLDKFFADKMAEYHVPGAEFVLVKDGEIFFAKGYGYADLENRIPVDPDRTVFRIASISKTFTYIAVLQLYEQGLIKLDDDVNKYFSHFQIEEKYSKSITVANLLTHTDGFEARIIGLYARSPFDLLPLREYLTENMPCRILPPGKFITYGNYATVLAGYLVEEIYSNPFAQCLDENIFQPLGMNRSSFQQPIPPHLLTDLAIGYEYKNDIYQLLPLLHKHIVPAGGMCTTARDMARLMIALLQGGRYENARILNESTVQEMFRQQFNHHPRLPGMTYGFLEHFENNQRALQRDGDGLGRSRMLIMPERNIGFFVAYNNREDKLREELVSQFLDHYYSVKEQTTPHPHTDFKNRASRIIGNYRPVQFDRSTCTKIQILFATQNRVSANNDGTLTIEPLGMGDAYGGFEGATRWVEVEPLFFQRIDGEGYLAFEEDDKGRITHLYSGAGYLGVFEKVPWYETSNFHYILIGFFDLLFLSAFVAWGGGSLISHLKKRSSHPTRSIRMIWLLAGLVSILNLVFMSVVAPAIFLPMTAGIPSCVFGIPAIVFIVLVIPLLNTALTIVLLIFTLLAWKNNHGSVAIRLYYSFVMLAALTFIWFLDYWNLLGFRF